MTTRAEIIAWLQQRSTDQARLRRQVETVLRQDTRLAAVWWFGSYARHASDALSDLDVWLVADDTYLDHLVDERYRYIAQVGQPFMVLEVWGNAPDPGAYLMANYLMPGGLCQVDWYWQAARQARLPRDGRVIFDRVGLPSAPERVTVDFARGSQAGAGGRQQPDDKRASLSFNTIFFWSMVPIVAKKIARRELDAAATMLDRLVPRVNTMAALLDIPAYAPTAAIENKNIVETALTQLAALRRIMAAVQAMQPACAATGAEVPGMIHSPIHTQIDRIEQMLRLDISLQELDQNAR
jgi:predicted nucleotidyltransferase